MLQTLPPDYWVDGKLEVDPIGLPCHSLEAHYKQIVVRPSVKAHLRNILNDRVKVEVAGFLPAPLALASVMLRDEDKEKGCVLIDFGAGTSSFVVYEKGKMKSLRVIPLGSNLITNDLAVSFSISETEAERLKKIYAQAEGAEEMDPNHVVRINMQGDRGEAQVKIKEIIQVAEARAVEIVENICHWIEEAVSMRQLTAGVIIAGGGADLKGLNRMIEKRLNAHVRYAEIALPMDNACIPTSQIISYALALGLINQGDEECTEGLVSTPEETPTPPVETEVEKVVTVDDEEDTKVDDEEEEDPPIVEVPIEKKDKKKKTFHRLTDLVNDLFSDQY